ncbi:MAG: hypothetical protein ACKO0V_08545 [bacterium]
MDLLNGFGGLACFISFFILGTILVQLTHHRETRREQTTLFLMAYLIRSMMVLVVYYFGLITIIKDEDSSGWTGGLGLYESWVQAGYGLFSLPEAVYEYFKSAREGAVSDGGKLHIGYNAIVAVEFFLLNSPGRIPAAMLNVFVGSLVPVFAYRLSMQIFNHPKAAKYVGMTLVFMPSLVLFSAQTQKEPIVVLLEVLGLYCCLQFCQFRFKPRYFICLAICIMMVYYLRFYIVYVFIGTFIMSLVIPSVFKSSYRYLFLIVGLLISPLAILVTYQSAVTEIQQIQAEQARRLKSYADGFGTSDGLQTNSNIGNPFDITKGAEIIPGLLFGFVHLMYAPFPWHLARGSTRMLLTTPEMLWWYYNATIRLFRGFRYGLKINKADMLLPFLFVVPLIFFYSLIFNNIGLAYRYRAQITPELMLFISLGYSRVREMASETYDEETEFDEEIEPEHQIPQYQGARWGRGYSNANPYGNPGFYQAQFHERPGVYYRNHRDFD